MFALEQPPEKPPRRKGAARTPYAGSLLKTGPDPVVLAGADLCKAIWARLEHNDRKPQGITYSGWRARNSRAAQEIIASGVTVEQALSAWDRCFCERRFALYSLFKLQGEIARQSADDRDRGGGAGGSGYTDAELDEE